jgi:hypothetical protein
MESFSLTRIAEIASAVGSVATPLVVATVAYAFQRRQKVAEAAMTERIKRIGLISPLLNSIYSYRHRVGSYLELSPEEVLRAKREADREFWTFEYLWTPEFKAAYHAFMEESFEMNRGAGNKAGIRAESKHYPVEQSTPDWVAFTEETVDKPRNALRYERLQAVTARDLGFRK